MKVKLFIIVCFSTLASFAQGEANIWYFGNHAGLDFNSGSPMALTNGQLNTDEGCATLSNAAGQLLFYTDGVTVYNKNHQVMLNGTGLMGHTSTTQSATIVPKPGSTTLFYIFTIDVEAHPNGFRYSIVDIALDGGLGAVTVDKNVLVYTPTCEKISIIKHANNIDYWVVTHGFGNNTYYAHLLTGSGLSNTPVLSSVGYAPMPSILSPDNKRSSYGYMKISPDGSKLAVVHASDGIETGVVELYDFDNVTGIISNPLTLIVDLGEMYGVEFSPNSEVLYYSNISTGKIRQYDLTAANIPNSEILFSFPNFSTAALQLGPDKKIYFAQFGSTKIGVINNPNIVGVGCDIQSNVIDLGGKKSILGLPAFNQSFFFNPSIVLDNACVGQSTQFSLVTNQTITSATWDFGDGNSVNAIQTSHVYAAAGTYTVSVTAVSAQGTGTKTRDIVISEVPTATQPQDLKICDTNNDGLYAFDLTTQNTAILNGQNSSQYTIKYFANATDYANNVAIATPANYTNATAYQSQTIIAEVSNNANGDCKATTTFAIAVFDSPKPNASTNIPALTSCDNTSVGTDTDGKVIFDLTQRASAILNGQSATQFSISYYRDAALTNQILTPANYSNINPTETIYVKVVNNANTSCIATSSFGIQVFSLPVITTIADLKQCDDNIDGFSVFNLTEANSKISTNYANETFSYFETLSDAQNNINPILNFTSYTNQIVSNDMVFVKVSNANGCSRIAQLNLIVSTTQIPLNFTRTFTQCDDAVLGTNIDGIASFDFSSVTAQIQSIFPVGQQLIITYYRNLADALAENNAITDISNYRNIGYPNTQNIYIRVDSQLNNDCLGLGQHITLNVERIPIVLPQELKHCDDNQDGQYAFDTSNVEANLLNGLTNVSVTYFDQNNVQLTSPLPNPFTTASQTITAVVTNNTPTACNYQTTIKFVVDDLPEAFPIPVNLTTVCDNELNPVNQDGQFGFDTATFQTTILGGQTGMIVKYYDQNSNPLPSPLPNPFVTATQNVRVEVINPINTSCTASLVITFVVKPVPNINLIGNELVCNEQTITKILEAGILDGTPTTDYTYVWKLNGTVLAGEINSTLTINTAGIYTVEVFNSQGCSRTRTITVVASDVATIMNIQVSDLSNHNSIVVTVSGLGNYVYSLDNVIFQESNTFSNIEAGIYTVYVKDLNGCGIAEKEISVLGIPDFFTPNGDGYNDYWNIQGTNSKLSAATTIYIFDRFGKLIKEISPSTQGWDGKFNSEPLPATDYWYSIALGDGRIVKGHFALKR